MGTKKINQFQEIEPLFDFISKYIKVSDEEKRHIANVSQIVTFKKNEIIHQQGKQNNILGFILKGGGRAFYLNEEGEEHTIEFFYENEMIGDYDSLIKQQPTYASAQALEETKGVVISRTDFLNFLEKHPHYFNVLSQLLSNSIADVTERSKLLRITTSRERYEAFCEMRPIVAQRAPLTHIASYLGMALGTLSRVRAGKL